MHVANPFPVSRASFPGIHRVGEKETVLPPLLAGKKRDKKRHFCIFLIIKYCTGLKILVYLVRNIKEGNKIFRHSKWSNCMLLLLNYVHVSA